MRCTAAPLYYPRIVAVLESRADPSAPEFRANREHNLRLVEDLRARLERVRQGGGAEAVARHRARGKLLARERIEALLDPGRRSWSCRPWPPTACTTTMRPPAGIVTGIGSVCGKEVAIVANDATVKGGTYYPLTVKKHLRAAGDRRPEPPAVRLPGRFGRRVSAAASGRLPRPRALRTHLLQSGQPVGARHRPGRGGHGFVYRRRRLRAGDERRDGHRQGHRDDLHRRPAAGESGHRRGGRAPKTWAAPTSTRASPAWPITLPKTTCTRWRSPVASWPTCPPRSTRRGRVRRAPEPRFDPRRSVRHHPARLATQFDIREVIARIVDGSEFDEFKASYGTTLVTGLCAHHGLSRSASSPTMAFCSAKAA